MAASSQDQPDAAKPPQSATPASKPRSWLRMVIAIVAPVLVIVIVLVILTNLKILPQNWFVPLLSTLGPIFGAIGAFINNALLSNKDFQQSFRTWLGKRMVGETDEKKENTDGKDAGTTTQAAAQPITINITNTNTNTNTAPSVATSTPQSSSTAPGPSLPPAVPQPQPALPAPQSPPATAPTAAATLPALSGPIFFPGLELPAAKEFYGRMIEREQLLSRTRTRGCTSIVGPRRIGKTWLMAYLHLVAADELGANFHIGHISATLPTSTTIAGFTREALQALGKPSYALPEHPDLAVLLNFVRDMVKEKQIPILCIDEFEGFTYHQEFNRDFFTELRAITEIGLVLVVLSKEPLIDIVSESTKTSPFFNVFLQLQLIHFNRRDAEQFVQEKSTQAQLTELDRTYLLAFAHRENDDQLFPPLRLQLAGETLLADKRAAAIAGQHHYRPNDPEYWQAFKNRVDAAYRGMVKP